MRYLTKEEYVALAAFRKAVRTFLRFGEQSARQAGITPQQYLVLLAIKGREGRDWAAITEIGEALQLRHNAAVGLIDRCQAAGLVVRSGDPDDRRRVRVTLTEAGEERLNRVATRNLRELTAFEGLIAAFTESQRSGNNDSG